MSQPPDSHEYWSVGFAADTLRFFANALRFYAATLENDLAAIQMDPELAKLLDERSLRSFQISREIKESREMADRTEKMIARAEEMGDAEMTISHGLVRKLKALGFLYLADLERRRNQIATGRALTTYGTELLDTKLLELSEKLERGVFGKAEPMPLLISPTVAARPATAEAAVTIVQPTYAAPIELVDPELRERCLDLFNDFDAAAQPHRFDTVVGEATRVLEDRIRKAGNFTAEVSGVDLMKAAFSGNPPKLQLSSVTAEQEGAHLLFRGVIGFIRNPAHHRIEKIERERAAQVLGFIDYLLYLVESATKTAAP